MIADARTTEECPLSIYICVPGNCLKRVSVRTSDCISTLSHIFPGSTKMFIYMGQVLSEAMTFGFYGISNDDRIVTLSKAMKNTTNEQFWLKISIHASEFREMAVIASSQNLKNELARLNDIAFFKAEGKVHSFRRACAHFNQLIGEDSKPPESTNIIFDSPASPSSNPLPMPWH